MLLGIDVGGTFTDAVVVAEGKIVAQAKSPTTDDLLSGILASLDMVLNDIPAEQIQRISLSTTFVTNALVQGKSSRVGLLIIPGPGLDYTNLLPVQPVVLDGYIDHRGRETAPVRKDQVQGACRSLAGCDAIVVSGKFSVRNPQQEAQVADWVADFMPGCHITRGAEVSGGLNFWRRTNSAYFNAAVWRTFGVFADAAESAVRRRGIQAPIYILKADGGTLPLAAARRLPLESVLTGPAASVLGILAAARPNCPAVSLDIGGTTTDIALWQNGIPLLAPNGVQLAGYPTAVRSFRLRSIGIGGDSVLRRVGETITVGPERLGSSAALGGKAPTLSDAMIVAGMARFGDSALARQAINSLTLPGETLETLATQSLATAVEIITREIQALIAEHYSDPVYRVEDLLAREQLTPESIIVVGGAGKALGSLIVKAWVQKTGRACELSAPVFAEVANAIGAAVARPTIALTVRADSEQGFYSVPELGIRQKLERHLATSEAVAQLAKDYLLKQAAASGIAADTLEIVLAEEFNLVRGFRTVGKNILLKLQVKPGVLTTVSGGEV